MKNLLSSQLLLCKVVLFTFGWLFPVNAQSDQTVIAAYSIDWNPDGTKLVVSTNEGLGIYDAELLRIQFRQYPDEVSLSKWSPDGSKIIVGREIWDATNLNTLISLKTWWPYFMGWDAEGKRFFGISDDGQGVAIYSVDTGMLLTTLKISEAAIIYNASWSPDNTKFALAINNNRIVIIDAVRNLVIAEYNPAAYVGESSFTWSEDSQYLIYSDTVVKQETSASFQTASPNAASIHSLHIVEAISGREILKISPIPFRPSILEWNSHAKELVGVSPNGIVIVWDSETGLIEQTFAIEGRIYGVSYSPFGGRLAIAIAPQAILNADLRAQFSEPEYDYQISVDQSIGIVALDPSLEKLQSILGLCGVGADIHEVLAAKIEAGDLEGFIADVSALTDAQIPVGCKADLLAVARALAAEGE